MENFKTAHVRFEDANIKFMENKISMLWTDTGCSTNCKKTSVVKLDDLENLRYCVIKDNEYNFIQVKKKSDNEICSLDEAIKSETCFIVKENEEHAVNNMLEYIKKSYEGDDSSSKKEKIINLKYYSKRNQRYKYWMIFYRQKDPILKFLSVLSIFPLIRLSELKQMHEVMHSHPILCLF